MNRRARRACKVPKPQADRVTAVHEAGHAVARVLTASDMGFGPERAIEEIEIGGSAVTVLGENRGGLKLEGQAITRGPMFSLDIMVHIDQPGPYDFAYLRHVVMKAGAAGADTQKWLKAKALIMACGTAAEAKLLSVNFDTVWQRPAAAGDLGDIIRDCHLAGVDTPEAINAVSEEAADRAITLFERKDVWRAVLAVADILPAKGVVKGDRIARIVLASMAS